MMTSSRAHRPADIMTTAQSRPSRLATYTMPNGINEKTTQGISPGFGPPSNFHPSKDIWSNPISNNRDVPGSRGVLDELSQALATMAAEDAYAHTDAGSDETSPSGFGSLPNTTDAIPWATANPWAAADQTATRPTSGSASPKRTRDDRQVLPMPNGAAAAFFDPAPANGVGAIRNGYPLKLMMDDEKDMPMAPFGSSYPSTYGYDQDAANSAFRQDKRPPQEPSYLGISVGIAGGAFAPQSREGSIPPSRQSHHSVQDVFGLGDRHTPNGISQPVAQPPQRPPMPTTAFAAANSRAYNFNSNSNSNSSSNNSNNSNNNNNNSGGGRQDDELTERFRKSLKLSETPANAGLAMPASTSAATSYPGVAPQHHFSHLNSAPGTTWADGGVDGGVDGLGHDAYADSLPGQYGAAPKRNPADRISHMAGPYNNNHDNHNLHNHNHNHHHHHHNNNNHHNNVPSPRNFAAGADVWTAASRPPSHDAKTVTADIDRRVLHPYMPSPQMHQYYQAPPQFFPGFPQQYGLPYDSYAMGGYARPPLPFPGYGPGPVSPYLSGSAASPRQQQREQDPARGMRSLLLEEFKGHKNHSRYTLKEIYGHVVEFSGDQHGSRFIQSKLETANSDEKEVLFKEIGPNAVQLMKDVFGNYVIQKFFAHGNQIQKKVLAGHMKGKMIDLSLQMYSCRVVQKALEHVLVEQQAEMAKELEYDVLRVIKDQNGNHVVQKIIELVPRQYIGFIMDSMRGQISQLASHLYGCRVIQRLLEHGSEQDKDDLLDELHASAQILITDQYGNYVAQHIIQLGKPEDRSRVIQLVTSQLLTLSKHKFASNVVEKCIQHGSDEERNTILAIITDKGSDPSGPLYAMMKDQYGNYVIQKLYLQLQGDERATFLELLLPLINLAKKANSTRQITALERLIYGPPNRGDGGAQQPENTPPGQATLQVDVISAAPTPSLTNGLNSPLSTSPTSVTAGATGDAQNASVQALGDHKTQSASPDVRVHEV